MATSKKTARRTEPGREEGLDYSKFDNDPGDERPVPANEMYELSLGLGHTPESYVNDAKYAARYGKWLRRLSRRRFEEVVHADKREQYAEKLARWLRFVKAQ